MRRKPPQSAAALLVAVTLLAPIVVGCSRLAPGQSGESTPGAPAASPSLAPDRPSGTSTPGVSPPPPSAGSTPASAGCFDPSASPAPVVYTNPDGAPGPEPPEGDALIAAARGLATFAGVWVDDFRNEVHVAVTCDVEGAIASVGHLVRRDQTVVFHLVEHTHAELELTLQRVFDDQAHWAARDVYLGYGAVDEMGNRVEIGIDPLSPEIAEEMVRRYGEPIELVHVERPFQLPSPWPTGPEVLVATRATVDRERVVECGGYRFPASVLEGDTEDVPADLLDDLRAMARFWRGEFPGIERLSWRLIHRDAESAAFIARDDTGHGWIYLGMERDSQGWTPAGVGGCQPRGVLADSNVAHWILDPAFPTPGPEATELHILVTERECASGQPAFGRIAPPVVTYAPDELTLTVGVRPVGGAANCMSNPPTPATVRLPEPLGDRVLLDGGRHPPAPPTPDQ